MLDLKAGDKVVRYMGCSVIMLMIVKKVQNGLAYCAHLLDDGKEIDFGWTFSLETGGEVDEELGWNGVTRTGTYIKRMN